MCIYIKCVCMYNVYIIYNVKIIYNIYDVIYGLSSERFCLSESINTFQTQELHLP